MKKERKTGMGLLNSYEKIRMDKNAILKAERRNRSGGKKE